MSDEEIDFNRVVNDPAYRRVVMDRLNTETQPAAPETGGQQREQEMSRLAPATQDDG